MRHNPYRSPWRSVFVLLALAALAALIVAGVVASSRTNTPVSQATPTTAGQSSAVVEPETNPPTDDPKLVNAVFAFVEAYNLPTSNERNEALRRLSTPEGYQMVYRDPSNLSDAEKAAAGMVVTVVREDSSLQVESFEDGTDAVSVHVIATIRMSRDDRIIDTVDLPGQTSSWVKQGDTWKIAFVQF